MAATCPPAGRVDDRYCPRCALHYRRSSTGNDNQTSDEWLRGHAALPHVKCNSCSHEYVLEHINSHRVLTLTCGLCRLSSPGITNLSTVSCASLDRCVWQRMHDKKNISDSTREVRDSIENEY